MSGRPLLRLRCAACHRNLADVTSPHSGGSRTNPDWTRDGLLVTPRPNVDQRDYRPWHEANRGGVRGTPERAAATPWQTEDVDFDWYDRTYIWQCRCGATITRRHERISELWAAAKEGQDTPRWFAVRMLDA